MTKSFVKGYTDTAFGVPASLSITPINLNYAADFRVKSSTADEVLATNVTCPKDQPETLRVAQRVIKNVYAGTNIAPEYQLPIKTGTASLFELAQVWVEVESTDATYKRYVPIKVGTILTVPDYGNISADDLRNLVKRGAGLLYEANNVDLGLGLSTVIRNGVLKRKDLF